MGKKARVLVACNINGIAVKPDDVVAGSAELIKQLEGAGQADSHKTAVAYAEKATGREVIDLDLGGSGDGAEGAAAGGDGTEGEGAE